jgi:purine nucleosidase
MSNKSIYLFLLLIVLEIFPAIAQKQKVWLDSDTGNEMDDLYAIVRLLKDPSQSMMKVISQSKEK